MQFQISILEKQVYLDNGSFANLNKRFQLHYLHEEAKY